MRLFLAALLLAAPLLADGPQFEAASIKPFVRGTGASTETTGGPGTTDPTHIYAPAKSLRALIATAFNVRTYQVIHADALNGTFTFALVLPEGATKDDVKIMWRNLLISRFGLKYHTEQREFSVHYLVISPKGSKLIENKEPDPDATGPARMTQEKDGRYRLSRPGMFYAGNPRLGDNGMMVVANAHPLSDLVTILTAQVGTPVIDKTGLTGKYEYFLEFSRSDSGAASRPNDPAIALPDALEQQLGLRLVKQKTMLDVIAVDKIDRSPTEN